MLYATLQENLKEALKSSDAEKVATLRLLLSELQKRGIEKRGAGETETLSDAEVIAVFKKEAKKRKEAIALFIQGGRKDLAAKEERELGLLSRYLPQGASEEEVRKIIDEVYAEGHAEFPALMKEAMRRLEGRADGRTVSELAKKKIG